MSAEQGVRIHQWIQTALLGIVAWMSVQMYTTMRNQLDKNTNDIVALRVEQQEHDTKINFITGEIDVVSSRLSKDENR